MLDTQKDEALQYKIEVMQHYLNGGKVEYLIKKSWLPCETPQWNWAAVYYRIASPVIKPKQEKKILLRAYLSGPTGLLYFTRGEPLYKNDIRVLDQDKIVRILE